MTPETETDLMRRLLANASTIAIVGASNKSHRASYGVMRFLQSKGFKCIPVNPRLDGEILLGEKVYADLASIPDAIDIVDIFRNSAAAAEVVDEAIKVNAGAIWMQLGVINAPAAAKAQAAGIPAVMDRCPAQEWGRLGLD